MRQVAGQKIPEPGNLSFEDRTKRRLPYEWGFGSTPRTAKLREGLKWKAAVVKDFINIAIGLAKCTFRQGENIKVDLDRARLVTKSYRETDGQPWVTRVTKAFANLCEKFPIFIKPGELIVGDPNSAPDELRWYPEIAMQHMPEAVTSGGFSEMVTDDERKEIVEDICEFWKVKCISDRIKAMLPRDVVPDVLAGLATPIEAKLWEMGIVNLSYDYAALFKEGLRSRIERAEAKLKDLNREVLEMNPADYIENKNNWEAMAMCGRAGRVIVRPP